ncbi:MAG TPA: hypothetical protein VGO43_11815 [Pyrinomonadaceae bacterium]|jgi:transcriptional regulator NrdR family protein|nr:hypothetical protein [Pyrinomonadaceae bacterium]
MKHPVCGGETAVINSRPQGEGRIWRRRRCVECRDTYTTFEITKKELDRLMEAEEKLNELDGPNWAVIAFRGVVKTEISYSEAADLMKRLQLHPGNGGLAIVSVDAAARLHGRKNA